MLRKKTTLIVIHVTATTPSMDIGVKEVRQMHKARGFSDIGYHWVIRRDGRVERGRAENMVGAHVAGWNATSVGVSLVGGVDERGKAENNMTTPQWGALLTLAGDLVDRYPQAKICGHRDLSPDGDRDGVIRPAEWIKQCPCFDAIPWARANQLPAADIRGNWDMAAPLVPKAPDFDAVEGQRLLVLAGYQFGPIDGIVGPRTRAAIKGFQLAQRLEQTGGFDARTLAALQSVTTPRRAA
ncbi:MAG: hypothetical protein DI629_03530 [Mesorhizobium amorphae]|nr:MAG: hypothetical protein DI629_03530 [Mesorhizobium amorphae]